MESTRQHLLRVSDIVGEIDGRLRSLRLQAQKAERYKRYKAELKDLDLWSSAQRYLGYLAEGKSAAGELEEIRSRHDSRAGALEAEETMVEAERLAGTEEASDLAAAKDDLFALSNKAQLGTQRAAHHDAEAADLESRAAAGRKEAQELRGRAQAHGASVEEIAGRLTEIDAEAERRERAYDEEALVQDVRRAALAEARGALDAAVAAQSAASARIARLEAERAAALQRREDLAARLAGLRGEDATASDRLIELVGEEALLRENLAELSSRVEAARRRATEDEIRLASLRTDLTRGELELETLREEAHRRRSRLASLSEIQDRYERFQKGVRAIMQEHQEGRGAAGVEGIVADIVRPPPELEVAVEAVLGERLGNVIVESHEAGVEAIHFLKQKSEGRSSFIPRVLRAPRGEVLYDATAGGDAAGTSVDAPAFLPAPDAAAIADAWPTGDGVRGPMLNLIGYDQKYGDVAT